MNTRTLIPVTPGPEPYALSIPVKPSKRKPEPQPARVIIVETLTVVTIVEPQTHQTVYASCYEARNQ